MKKLVLLLMVVGLGILAAYACAFQVMEGESVIVARFGDPRRTIEKPGLHFKLPPPIDNVVRIDRRIHVVDPPANEYLTGDKKNVIVDCFLAWEVADARLFHISVGDRSRAETRIANILRSVVGDAISSYPFSSLVSAEPRDSHIEDVAKAITERARGKLRETLGVNVVVARIKRINFPASNKNSVFRRMQAERESTAATFRSEGQEQYEKIKADTDRAEAEILADAERKAAEIRGSADAESARIYSESISRDPELYLFLQSLDLLGEVLGDKSTLILRDDHPLIDVLRGPPTQKGKG